MMKIILTLLLTFWFNGFLNAQTNDSKKCHCDSILKTKIESRVSFAIAGRTAKTIIKPDYNTCEIGKFAIDIIVNRGGEVIKADLNSKISSEVSDKLKEILIDAAKKSKFMEENNAPAKQKGHITYEFRFKDK